MSSTIFNCPRGKCIKNIRKKNSQILNSCYPAGSIIFLLMITVVESYYSLKLLCSIWSRREVSIGTQRRPIRHAGVRFQPEASGCRGLIQISVVCQTHCCVESTKSSNNPPNGERTYVSSSKGPRNWPETASQRNRATIVWGAFVIALIKGAGQFDRGGLKIGNTLEG